MNFKNIKDFTLAECQAYLKYNPLGEERDAIYERMQELIDKNSTQIQPKMDEDFIEQPLKGDGANWIDILQFKAECKLRNLNFLRIFIYVVITPFIFLSLGAIYYSNTDHIIWSESSWEQQEYKSGVESLLLEMDFIRVPNCPYSEYWDPEEYEDYYPCYRSYDLDYGLNIFIIIYIPSILLLLLIINCFDSSIAIKRIYNIENHCEPYKRTQNTVGKYGLYKLNKFRLAQVLPIVYDRIYSCGPDSYICVMNNKMGVYNTKKRKMVIDVVYDKITALQGNALEVVKDGAVSKFTHEGYRVVV